MGEQDEKDRRGRGVLEADVKVITDKYADGTLVLPDGQALTPHRIGRAIKENDQIDEAPSTGAIVNVLNRWGTIGFADVSDKPLAFVDYTTAGRTHGLTALKEEAKAARNAEKKAAKEAATSAA